MSTSQKSTPEQTSTCNPITEQFGEVLNTLSSFKSQISMLVSQVKSLEKTVKKQMKQLTHMQKL